MWHQIFLKWDKKNYNWLKFGLYITDQVYQTNDIFYPLVENEWRPEHSRLKIHDRHNTLLVWTKVGQRYLMCGVAALLENKDIFSKIQCLFLSPKMHKMQCFFNLLICYVSWVELCLRMKLSKWLLSWSLFSTRNIWWNFK